MDFNKLKKNRKADLNKLQNDLNESSGGGKLKKGKQMIRKLGKYESFFAVTSALLVTGRGAYIGQ